MTREIKFRAWSNDYKKMFNSESVYICAGRACIQTVRGGDFDPKTVTIMQYTGLKDVHRKEIYDGDILAVDWNDQRYPPHTIGPVAWNEDDACWELGEGGAPKQDASSHMEIIGNIYENPELLSSIKER